MNQDVSSKSIFTAVKDLPADPVFGIQVQFKEDPRDEKYNLTVGFYSECDGTPHRVMPSVACAEELRLQQQIPKIYLPITGDPEYISLTGQFIFGDLYGDNIVGIETVGGTSALSTSADFLRSFLTDTVAVSNPSWANHQGIFTAAGHQVIEYPYYRDGKLCFDEMVESLGKLARNTAVILQPMSHNPSGLDLSFSQWEKLSEIFGESGLFPIFDTAYQGLGKSVLEDVEPIRLFVRAGHELIVTHSYSKSAGLYSERVGALYAVLKNGALHERVKRNIGQIIRTNYSNPPVHGAYIIKTILKDASRKRQWLDEVEFMRKRVVSMRAKFSEGMSKAIGTNRFDFIKEGNGYFSLLGLSKEQIRILRDDHAVYLMGSSRINIAALTDERLGPVLKAVESVL